MIVYVETNFLLEVAYLQERHDSCEAILDLARTGLITLALPAVAAAEARATWHRRASERKEFQASLKRHIREISRSEPFRELNEQSRDVVDALIAGGEESRHRLESAIQSFETEATVIPLTGAILMIARWMELTYSLSPQDALVLESVRSHAKQHGGPKIFVSQDAKGFAHPSVYDQLSGVDCKVLVNFADALAYVRSRVSNRAPE